MKTLVLYYSYTGNTKKRAREKATLLDAQCLEVKEINRPSTLKAYTLGCLGAIRGKKSRIEPIDADLASFDKIVIMAPVWAGNSAPAINSVFDMLPSGKDVEIIMVSGSGNSKCREKLTALVKHKGSKLTKYEDVRG